MRAGVFGCVLGACVTALCAGQADAQDAAARPPTEVSVITVTPRNTPAQFETSGKTESSRLVEIRARVEGYLERIDYQEGALVKTGDLLFQLDALPYEAAADSAKAQLAQAQARLINASATLKRVRPLAKEKAVSQKDLDDAVSAELEARAAVDVAKAQLRSAELNLGYTTIRSPLTGRAGKSEQREGSLVSPGANGLLTTLVQTDPMWVSFGVGEQDVLRFRRGLASGAVQSPSQGRIEVELTLADGRVYPHKAVINYVDPNVDEKTGTVNLRAEVANPDNALSPGQFVRVRASNIELVNAVMVPQRAVLQGAQGKVVYVVEDGKAQPRPIEAGQFYGDQWIINKGLKAGDTVVVDGGIKLAPGAPVKIVSTLK